MFVKCWCLSRCTSMKFVVHSIVINIDWQWLLSFSMNKKRCVVCTFTFGSNAWTMTSNEMQTMMSPLNIHFYRNDQLCANWSLSIRAVVRNIDEMSFVSFSSSRRKLNIEKNGIVFHQALSLLYSCHHTSLERLDHFLFSTRQTIAKVFLNGDLPAYKSAIYWIHSL
jgi:hypothetical protein